MDASSTTSAVQPGRGRVFDSIVDAIGNTPIVRLRRLPQAHGVNATILAKLEYFNPAASVKDRIGAANGARAVIGRVFGGVSQIQSANIFPFSLPPIIGLSTSGGFEYQLENLEGREPAEMASVMGGLLGAAAAGAAWRHRAPRLRRHRSWEGGPAGRRLPAGLRAARACSCAWGGSTIAPSPRSPSPGGLPRRAGGRCRRRTRQYRRGR